MTDFRTELTACPIAARYPAILALIALLASGCMLRDLKQQVELIDDTCLVTGSVAVDDANSRAVMVAMLPGDAQQGQVPRPIDFTLADRAGDFSFALTPGSYRFLAFEDRDGNLELDDDESARHAYGGEAVDCGAGEQLHKARITLAHDDRVESGSLSVQGSRSLVAGAMETAVSLGQLTSFGEVAPLSDPRFDLDVARASMWRPVDFLRAGHSGVYLREPLDALRTPVLFIHGINGSPRVLEPLIDSLDSERLQPMYFYYASGLRIDQVVWHLDRIMRELEHRHAIQRYHVVAHSMGGLIAQAWLRQRVASDQRAGIASFISLSTPWLGYPSARQGVDHSPVVVPVWRDMASGSEFLAELFSDQPMAGLPPLHLLFGYDESGWLDNEPGDGVATLASMLPVPVQRQATSTFGVKASHVGIVANEAALERVEHLLLQAETAVAVKSSAGSSVGAR